MGDFLLQIRNLVLQIAYPLTTKIGNMYFPFTRKKVTSVDYRNATEILKPGYGIITRTNGELANLFIPDYWAHIGTYVGDRKVVEAVGSDGVREVDLIDFLMKKDDFLIIKANFASDEEHAKAAEWTKTQVGKPYDHYFNRTNDAFYCSELYYQSFVVNLENVPWKPSKTWGMETVIPQDLAESKAFSHLLGRTAE